MIKLTSGVSTEEMMMNPALRKSAGFSLVELAILLVIVALIGGAIIQQYNVWYQSKISGDNGSRQTLISNALSLFYTTYGRLPCPADPSLAASAASAGYEVCMLSTFGASPPTLACSGQVCRVSGQKDTSADTDAYNDPVLIGSLPFASLGLTAEDGVDAWGNKITYAVSEYMTNNDTSYETTTCNQCIYNDAWTAITIKTLVLDGAKNELGIFPNFGLGYYPMIFLSHGPDGKGAYNYNGKLNSPCTGTARDVENCNGDAVFLAVGEGLYNTVPGSKFYDDAFTVYSVRKDSDKWTQITGGMENKTGGKVGINIAAPTTTLDVGGNIKLNSLPTLGMNGDTWANTYCSETGNCFSPSIIGGTVNDANPSASSAHCGTSSNPELMVGIDGSATWKTACVQTLSTLTITPTTCPTGQYMQGVDALGGIICVTP